MIALQGYLSTRSPKSVQDRGQGQCAHAIGEHIAQDKLGEASESGIVLAWIADEFSVPGCSHRH